MRSSSRRASARVGDSLGAGQVDELSVEPVACGEPLVLVEHLERVARQPLVRLEVLAELLDEALDERRESDRVLDAGL